MSQVMKSSLALAAILASAMAVSACAKKSDGNKTEFSNAETSTPQVPADASPELKAAMSETDCPYLTGKYRVVTDGSPEIEFSMTSVPGGVALTTANGTATIDGASHADPEVPGGTYMATCANQTLTITKTGPKGEKGSLKASFNEEGDLILLVNENGADSTTRMTKVRTLKDVPPSVLSEEEVAKQMKVDNSALEAIINAPFPAFSSGPEAAPATPAVEKPVAPAPTEAGGREDLRPMPTKSAGSSGSSQGAPKGQEIEDPSRSPERF